MSQQPAQTTVAAGAEKSNAVVFEMHDYDGHITGFYTSGHLADFEFAEAVRLYLDKEGKEYADYPISPIEHVYGVWELDDTEEFAVFQSKPHQDPDAEPYTLARLVIPA